MDPYDQSRNLKIDTDQPYVLLVVNNRQQMIHAVASFFYLYRIPHTNKWKTILIK